MIHEPEGMAFEDPTPCCKMRAPATFRLTGCVAAVAGDDPRLLVRIERGRCLAEGHHCAQVGDFAGGLPRGSQEGLPGITELQRDSFMMIG